MNKHKDDKWLDEIISRTINTTKPQFDSESWNQKYQKELHMLSSRAQKSSNAKFRTLDFLKKPITKFAIAAMIILAINFFIFYPGTDKVTVTTGVAAAKMSPSDMQTILALNIAYRRGGIESVDRQCMKAIEMLGPRPAKITIKQIMADFNGT